MRRMDFQDLISVVLRAGVLSSIFFVVFGVVLIFVTGKADGYPLSQLSNLQDPVSAQLNSSMLNPANIIHGIAVLDGAYYIALGLWILVFTPITVVVISLFYFLRNSNYRYVIMSVIVLVNLMVAMLVIR